MTVSLILAAAPVAAQPVEATVMTPAAVRIAPDVNGIPLTTLPAALRNVRVRSALWRFQATGGNAARTSPALR
jgi:hypothetical protein